MIFKDYYKILELETNKVTMEQIKTAYREQAKKYHPDVNVKDKFSEERFKDINEAYRILSQGPSKRKYDRMWNSHVGNKKKKQEYEETKKSIECYGQLNLRFTGNIKRVTWCLGSGSNVNTTE